MLANERPGLRTQRPAKRIRHQPLGPSRTARGVIVNFDPLSKAIRDAREQLEACACSEFHMELGLVVDHDEIAVRIAIQVTKALRRGHAPSGWRVRRETYRPSVPVRNPSGEWITFPTLEVLPGASRSSSPSPS